ncbi:pilus assembly protein CpaC [Hasllibacter halocynthiae]|uniref:Pilus assembly protein CpaC n=1 Tax=Hasllibacter halocynthiae TaxID=595589 RepID=A0A2T0X9J3_9RHOB|nr:type II and III secretion system protein family protein [Hasllibacter halocynthiae]PRY95621.1 pilus assembly protein CpaC [Hasllibacter halocynthiae]
MIPKVLRATPLALALALGPAGLVVPEPAAAQTLSVLSGPTSGPLRVPMNRAVVVESDMPFAELSIANPDIADISTLSDRTVYVLGRTPGRTTLTILGPDGGLLSNVEVQVTPDVAEFRERLQQILPGENIDVRTANDGIVLSGVVSSIQRLDRALSLAQRYAPERVSNLMSVGGNQQVMLKVRFAEMGRSVSRSLGGGIGIGIGGDGDLAGSAIGLGTRVPASAGGAVAGTGIFELALGDASVDILLDALEQRGLTRILAEPNLTALSGQEATFIAGGEYPVPTVQPGDDGENPTVLIEYKPFGVEMDFIPRVVDGDIINLELAAAISSLDPSAGEIVNGQAVQGFRSRATSTTVEIRDGESFAIAGLLQDDFRDSNNQVPFLGDIPILGALFRSAEYQRDQTELVIVITAHLVQPTRGGYALPTDNVRLPTERELFLLGRTEGAPTTGPAAEVARQNFQGSYGYVLD